MHLTTAVALCGVVALGSAAATTLVVHPDLSGQWTLNAAESDHPRDMLQARDSSGDEARAGRSRGGYGGRGGFGRGRGGGGGGGGGAGSGMSDEQRQRMHQTMQLAFDAPAALTIVFSDTRVPLASTLFPDTTLERL